MKYIVTLLTLLLLPLYGNTTTWVEEDGGTATTGKEFTTSVTFSSNVVLPTGASSISGAGSGSGLDADKLDGQHGAYYLSASSGSALENKLNASSGTVISDNILRLNNVGTTTTTIYSTMLSSFNASEIFIRTKLNASSGSVVDFSYARVLELQSSTQTAYNTMMSSLSEVDIINSDLVAKISTSIVTIDGNQTILANKTFLSSQTFTRIEISTIVMDANGLIGGHRAKLSIGTMTNVMDGTQIIVSTGLKFIGTAVTGAGILDFSNLGVTGSQSANTNIFTLLQGSGHKLTATGSLVLSSLSGNTYTAPSTGDLTIQPTGSKNIILSYNGTTQKMWMGDGDATRSTWTLTTLTFPMQNNFSIKGSTFIFNNLITLDNTGVAGNVYTRFASSDAWGKASSGGSGSSTANLNFPSKSWYVTGSTNGASIDFIEYETTYLGVVSSDAVIAITCPEAKLPNYAETQGSISNTWDAGSITAYITFVTSGQASGYLWTDMLVTTSPYTNAWSYYSATTTVPSNSSGYTYAIQTATITFTPSNISTTNTDFWVRLGRNVLDSCVQNVYYLNMKWVYTIN